MSSTKPFRWPGFGRIPAAYYGWSYLILIPTFALFYMLLPRYSFYHSTAQYEQALQGDAARIVKDFEVNFIERLKAAYPADVMEINGWTVQTSDLHVVSFKTTGDSFTFVFRVQLAKAGETGDVVGVNQFSLTYPANKIDSVTDLKTRSTRYLKYPTFDPPVWKAVGEELDYMALFPKIGERGVAFQPDLLLPSNLNERIEDFGRAYRGFPARVSGHFMRMLYLSAITITTVGYGDIVPMSPLARSFVALEAVLGVVVIGLFLNALVQNRKRES